MAQLNNRIRSEIEKYINNVFSAVDTNQVNEVNELFRRLENLLGREELKNVSENMHPHQYITREELINDVLETINIFNRIYEIYSLIQIDKENIINQLQEQINYFKKVNEEINPSLSKIVNIIELIEDFDVKIAGQTITYSIKSLKNLKSTVEQIYQNINLNEYRDRNKSVIEDLIKMIKEYENKFDKEFNEIKKNISAKVALYASSVIEQVAMFNIPQNEIFQNFVDSVKKISDVEIEIEIYNPSFDDDLLYTQFLNAKENDNREELLSIALTIFPDPELFYGMSSEDLASFIEENHFK